jgi:cytochrome c oxidase subunit 2
MSRPRALLPAACLLAAGCGGPRFQSALDPAGAQADRIDSLYHLFFWVCVGVYVVVALFIIVALMRKSTAQPVPAVPEVEPAPDAERRRRSWVIAGVAVTVVLLFVLLVGEFVTSRALDTLPEEDAVNITLTGHQWFWDVQYNDPDPSQIVMTANEIHVPVGRTVKIELNARDVIHSFWVPNLHGKKDLIPGHPTNTTLRADRPGVYWGQCAEYCGLQHANMRFQVIAEPEADFRRWLDAQRQPAPEPQTEGQRRGREVFLKSACVMCHWVGGTPAMSRVGPDLTHLASRQRIGAGTLPNTRGHLGGWVADPQGIKPGVRMPANSLKPADLRALLDYLESLK